MTDDPSALWPISTASPNTEPAALAQVVALFDRSLGTGYVPAEVAAHHADRGQLAVAHAPPQPHDSGGHVVGAVTWLPPADITDQLADFPAENLGTSPVGMVVSLAVAVDARGRGVGGRLLEHATRALATAGAGTVATVSWVSGSAQSSPRLFYRAGWRMARKMPNRWREDSLRRGYACPACGGPCSCTALLFVRAC